MPVLYDEGIIDVAVTAAASLLFTSARSRSAVHDFAVANAAAGRLPPLAPDAKPTMLVAGANRPVCSSDYTLEHRILFLFRIEKNWGLMFTVTAWNTEGLSHIANWNSLGRRGQIMPAWL